MIYSLTLDRLQRQYKCLQITKPNTDKESTSGLVQINRNVLNASLYHIKILHILNYAYLFMLILMLTPHAIFIIELL